MSSKKIIRPTWVEINLGAIRRNVRRLCGLATEKGVRLMAVVKANAYGHGAPLVARTALEAGASALAVALPEEGIVLRKSGIDAPILVMGAFVSNTASVYGEYNLTATISHPLQAEAIAAQARQLDTPIKVHLKVDTGMGRLGVLPENTMDLTKPLMQSDHIDIEGVFTHLATAEDRDTAYTKRQLGIFESVVMHLAGRGLHPKWIHSLNSAGLLQHAAGMTNIARVGLASYGIYPAEHLRSVVRLEPAMAFYSRVVAVKDVPAGTPVSYGCTYRTQGPTKLAALPVGYADGLSRRLSHRVSVIIRDHRFPVVGTICMDQAMIDVGQEAVDPGDVVTLFGGAHAQAPGVEEWADALGTISYEVLCSVSARVPRVYVDDEQKLDGKTSISTGVSGVLEGI